MAFNPPVSGWTAMSLAPNPDLFAAATNNINRVSSSVAAPAGAAVAAPLLPLPSAPAYAQLSQNMFPQLQQQKLQQQQLAAQATAAPANAFAAVEKSLKADPWTKPLAPPQSNFVNPTAGAPTKPQASGWVPSNSLPTI